MALRDTGRALGLLVARCSLGALFLYTGARAILDFGSFAERIGNAGYPAEKVVAALAVVAQVAGGISVVLGALTPLGCLALVLFLLPTTYSFHLPGLRAGDVRETIQTLKNLALVGGLISLWFAGPGPLSVDRQLLKRGRA